jgi:hypothetical protein
MDRVTYLPEGPAKDANLPGRYPGTLPIGLAAGRLGQPGRRFGPGRKLVDVGWLVGGCVQHKGQALCGSGDGTVEERRTRGSEEEFVHDASPA